MRGCELYFFLLKKKKGTKKENETGNKNLKVLKKPKGFFKKQKNLIMIMRMRMRGRKRLRRLFSLYRAVAKINNIK